MLQCKGGVNIGSLHLREEKQMAKLSHIKIQIKKTKVDAFFDSNSQANFIIKDLISKLGLEVHVDPRTDLIYMKHAPTPHTSLSQKHMKIQEHISKQSEHTKMFWECFGTCKCFPKTQTNVSGTFWPEQPTVWPKQGMLLAHKSS